MILLFSWFLFLLFDSFVKEFIEIWCFGIFRGLIIGRNLMIIWHDTVCLRVVAFDPYALILFVGVFIHGFLWFEVFLVYCFCLCSHLIWSKIDVVCVSFVCSLKRSRKFQPDDRLFSLSSVTSPAVWIYALPFTCINIIELSFWIAKPDLIRAQLMLQAILLSSHVRV